MKIIDSKAFANGVAYALETDDGYPIEVTDTHLPINTRERIKNQHTNQLTSTYLGDRSERWMIGVSVMSGCPVRCKFCATGQLKQWRNLTAAEIAEQVDFVVSQNPGHKFNEAQAYKINYTRMGEPFLNTENVRDAIALIEAKYPNTHHYVSTIGIKGSDYSWIKDNITLQVSLHACSDVKRNDLIPYNRKFNIAELGKIRTESDKKTTLNLTLVEESDFDIDVLKQHFPKEHFFIKLSPINPNVISDKNRLGSGAIVGNNLV